VLLVLSVTALLVISASHLYEDYNGNPFIIKDTTVIQQNIPRLYGYTVDSFAVERKIKRNENLERYWSSIIFGTQPRAAF
jgi:hypothetical protein